MDPEPFGQHPAHELLGRGLAVRTDDAEDRNPQPAPVLARQLLQGRERILHHDQTVAKIGARSGDRRIVDHSEGGPRSRGIGGEAVAVERSAAQGKKSDPGAMFRESVVTAGWAAKRS